MSPQYRYESLYVTNVTRSREGLDSSLALKIKILLRSDLNSQLLQSIFYINNKR